MLSGPLSVDNRSGGIPETLGISCPNEYAYESVVITAVCISAAFSNSQDVQDLFGAVNTTSESKRTDTKFFVGCPLQRFEMFGWVSPFVSHDFVEFGGDTVTCVIVEAIEIPS